MARTIETVSTSRADDAAFRALDDIARISEGITEIRVVGGQMVGLLLTAFPAVGAVPRRTVDADAAISISVAASGVLHERLTRNGYMPVAGNRYERGAAAVDLIVPARDARFRHEIIGGRGFDAVPGVRLALSADPIHLDVGVTYLDGSHARLRARVPAPEIALVLKAYASRSRVEPKDLTDLFNLLQIINQYSADEIGETRLAAGRLLGQRLDAGRILHQLADGARRSRALREAGVSPAEFTALVRRHIADPR